MKKTLFKTALLLGLAVLLSSCMSFFGSNPRVAKTFKMTADIGIPAAQSATVTFIDNLNDGYFKLKKWNGQDISFRLYGFNFDERYVSKYNKRNDKAILVLPAGDNSFIFEVRFEYGGGWSLYDNIELRYSLEAGREYHIKGRIERMSTLLNPTPTDDITSYYRFVGIYDVTGGSETLLREWQLPKY
jgi:hypothetical protein